MNKLRIGVVLDEGYAPTAGGGFSYFDKLIKEIDHYNFDERIEIVFINLSSNIRKNYNKETLKIDMRFQNKKLKFLFLKILVKKTWFRHLSLANKIAKKIEESRNITIENIFKRHSIELLYYGKPTSFTFNYPYIATHWDMGHKSTFAFPEVAMNGTFDGRDLGLFKSLQKAFAIFVESEESLKELVHYERINKERIFVLPLFPGDVINLTVSNDEQQLILKKWDLKNNEFFFYPAQFWSHKNHFALIKAFEIVIKKNTDLKLLLTGSDKGNQQYIYEVVNKCKLNKSVIFTGFIGNEEIYTFYKNTISLVMPSYLGPTNMPLLEANNLGCTVLCSNIEGHKKLMSNEAIYFDPKNFFELAEKMLEQANAPVKTNKHKRIENDVMAKLNKNFLDLIPMRKAFGFNFEQY